MTTSLLPHLRSPAPDGAPCAGQSALPAGDGLHSPRRRWLGTLAFGALALSPLALLQRALAAGNQPQPPGLRRVSGAVSVNGQPAREGLLIRPGDTVVTGADGEAIYVLGEHAFLQRATTTVSFGSDAASFLRLVSGRLLAVFGSGERTLRFPTATIGIRGTACYIDSQPERDYFCLCYGEAELTPLAAPASRRRLRTRHHDEPYYITAEARDPLRPAPVVGHGDAELLLLENLVGRWPPFEGNLRY